MKKTIISTAVAFAVFSTCVYAESGETSWTDKVEIGGVIEVEAQSVSPDGGDTESDIYVATAELGIGAKINDNVSSEIVLLYEGPDGELEVDAATITIEPSSMPVSFTIGKMGVPFGVYDTNLLSDPLTLELGETAVDGGAQVAFESNGFNAAAFIFNGASSDGDNSVNDYAMTAGYAMEGDFSFAIQLGYMNHLGNTDSLSEDYDVVQNDVGAMTAAVSINVAGLSVIGEYLAATEAFADGELDHNGKGAEPKAWNAEIAYSFGKSTLAIGHQGTDEASAILPESKNLIAYSVEIYDNTAFTLEYSSEEDYAGAKTDIVTAQVAVEF